MLTTKAELLARQLHTNQVDKAGKPYIEHLQAVVNGLSDRSDELIAVAWLHDSIEDTDLTLGELKAQFGSAIANAVEAMTKRTNEPYQDYLLRVKSNPLARIVKLSDLTHNMDLTRLSTISEKDLQRKQKYEQARIFLNNIH